MQVEREIEEYKSHENFLKIIKELNLTPKFQSHFSNNLEYQIIQCSLLFNNKEIISGAGKGTGKAPLIGAEFESLEHYYFLNQKHSNKKMQLKILLDQNLNFKLDPALNLLAEEYGNIELYVDKFKEISGSKNIYYPCFMNDINFNKDSIDTNSHAYNYSSNNGFASGNTRNESLIHGINELIERDSISNFLIKYGLNIQGKKIHARIIKKDSLTPFLRKLYNSIEKTLQAKIYLIELINSYDIPTFFAISKDKKRFFYPLYGGGTSIFKDYAVERALTELLQLFLLFNTDAQKMYNQMDLIWKKIPIMYATLQFEFLDKLSESEYKNSKKFSNFSIREILNFELSKLKADGACIFWRDIQNKKDFSLIQVLIPGFELFNLTLEGKVVLPRRNNKI